MTISKTSFEKIYRNEQDAKTKERMLLVLNVVYNNIIPAHATKDLHRSRAWASDWLKRYDKEGIDGLESRSKSGRPSKLSKVIAGLCRNHHQYYQISQSMHVVSYTSE